MLDHQVRIIIKSLPGACKQSVLNGQRCIKRVKIPGQILLQKLTGPDIHARVKPHIHCCRRKTAGYFTPDNCRISSKSG